MSILSDFEDRVGGAVEGMFAGVFRSPVQPAELARACAKEMDRRRKLGVGKVYAPTMYSVLLSPADGEQLGGFSSTLSGELETYLVGYAREKDYLLSTRPRVRFLVDDALKLGRFEVIGELLSADEIAAELGDDDAGAAAAAAAAAAGHAAVSGAVPLASPTVSAQPAVKAAEERPRRSDVATLRILETDDELPLTGDRLVLGRLKSCDICLDDRNASRQHAAIEREGAGWLLVDLESTNGTLVNGEPADRVRLRDGDVITIGVSEIVFHEAGASR